MPSAREWDAVFEQAENQSIIGVCFSGLRRLGADGEEGFVRIGMSEDQYLNWMGEALQIKMGNEQMNKYTKEALAFFRSKGFACQVLKGQGIATLYRLNDNGSDDLRLLRQSGDIDIWLAGGRSKVYQFSREVLGKITGANYHHIHFPIWDDPEIEAHIYPSFVSITE